MLKPQIEQAASKVKISAEHLALAMQMVAIGEQFDGPIYMKTHWAAVNVAVAGVGMMFAEESVHDHAMQEMAAQEQPSPETDGVPAGGSQGDSLVDRFIQNIRQKAGL